MSVRLEATIYSSSLQNVTNIIYTNIQNIHNNTHTQNKCALQHFNIVRDIEEKYNELIRKGYYIIF